MKDGKVEPYPRRKHDSIGLNYTVNSYMNIAKKALSSVVVSTTILWSMGASMLVGTLTAHAAVADGTLIKAKEIEAVYYYKGGKRWTFPNLKTYKTWFKDFSSVQTVTLAELQTYQLTGNVVYRSGSRLVKITTDPKVYAVEPGGKLRWVKDEATAKALFGADWSKRVDDVSDAFFTNYTIGADLQGTTYPDGTLLSSGGSYYYVQGGMKRAVGATALSSNGFNTAYAIAVADVSAYANGSAVADGEFKDVAQGGFITTVPGPVSSSGSVSISLASDTPATGSFVVNNATSAPGQRQVKVLKFNLTASSGDAVVTQLQVKRLGVSKDGDVDNLYIADANGKILAKNTSLSNGVAAFASASGLFTVPSGQTASLWLLEDVNHSAAAGSTQSWTVDASGIKLAGAGSATGSATGNTFTAAAVTDLGVLEMATSSPVSGTPKVDAGKTGYTLGTFKFKAASQDIIVKKLKLTQIGSIANGDLANFKLQIGGVQFDGVKASMDAGTLTFDLSKDSSGVANADMGVKILAGQTKFVDLIGDVVGGTNRTYAFSVQNQEDVLAFDNAYKVYVPVFAGVNFTGTVFAVQTLTSTTVNVGTLTISQASDAPTGNIAKNGSSVALARFTLQANGEDVKLSSLTVVGTAASTTFAMRNVKILLDGQQVGTTVSSSTAQGDVTSTNSVFTFSNNFVVHTGKPSVLEVQADLTDSSVLSGHTIAAALKAGSANGQGLTSLTSIDSTAISGNTLTVKSGTPTVTLNTAVTGATSVDPSGVLNGRDVRIGSFIVQAGDGEGAKVTSIQLADATVALNGLFSRLRLRDANGTILAPEVGTLSASGSTYNFSLTNAMTLQKGEQRVVDVIVDVLSTTSSAAITDPAALVPTVKISANGLNYQTLSTGQSGTTPAAALSLQNTYLSTKGSLTVANSADTPVAQQLVMGAVAQPIFKFKLTAGRQEDVNITDLASAITIKQSAASPTGIVKNLRLYEGDTAIGQVIASLTASDATTTGATSTAYAKFSSLSINIPRNTSKTYTVVADIAASPDIYSNENFTANIVNGYNTNLDTALTVKGSSSGLSITAAGNIGGFENSSFVRGSMMTVYRTKISVAHSASAPSGAASAQTEQIVGKFVISNTANVNNAAATIKLLNVDVATSISLAAGSTRLLNIYKTETLSSDNQLATSNVNAAVAVTGAMVCVPGSSTYNSTTCPALQDSAFTDITIEAGSSQVFTVTFNTTDATSAKTLTIGIPGSLITTPVTSAGGYIQWSDGYTGTIQSVNTLPLIGKTLTY